MKRFILLLGFVLLASLIAMATQKGNGKVTGKGPDQKALDMITTDGLMRHIKTLASDEYEGRGPGTRGEDLSIKYIADQFQSIGLAPGNTDGTYFQKVPL